MGQGVIPIWFDEFEKAKWCRNLESFWDFLRKNFTNSIEENNLQYRPQNLMNFDYKVIEISLNEIVRQYSKIIIIVHIFRLCYAAVTCNIVLFCSILWYISTGWRAWFQAENFCMTNRYSSLHFSRHTQKFQKLFIKQNV